ncbi:hypothetical protein EJB05_31066, partial [Eragrostis curvula]
MEKEGSKNLGKPSIQDGRWAHQAGENGGARVSLAAGVACPSLLRHVAANRPVRRSCSLLRRPCSPGSPCSTRNRRPCFPGVRAGRAAVAPAETAADAPGLRATSAVDARPALLLAQLSKFTHVFLISVALSCWYDVKCNNPEKGIKCNYVKFKKQGPKHLDDLHILFEKVLVTGASASCPGDISDDSSDDDVAEVQKTPESDDVKLAELKKAKPGKKKRKDTSTATEEKDEKSPFFCMYKNTYMRIETAAEKISTSASASSAPPKNEVPTIKEAMQMVRLWC